MDEQFEAEVRDMHLFLARWFSGDLPRSPESFAEFTKILAGAFELVSPNGTVRVRERLISDIESAHGCNAGTAKSFRIWIENCRLRFSTDGYCLGTYEEWQAVAGATTGRISTVLFGHSTDGRHGLEWLHLHETWILGHEPAS